MRQRVICPSCTPNRKPANRREAELSLTEGQDGVLLYYCHHCHIEGGVPMRGGERMERQERMVDRGSGASVFQFPPPEQRAAAGSVPEASPLSPSAVAYLMGRGISEETACECGVGSLTRTFNGGRDVREVLVFPYEAGGKAYAQKLRHFPDKGFSQNGAASTFWLKDQVQGGEDLIIVEGEFDALAVRETGHRSVVSVPNGAPQKVSERPINSEEDRKFRYVWDGVEIFKAAKRVIIACDNDEPGRALAEEIARRWGRVKSWRVVWPDDCKDANDVLIKHGSDKLKEILANPEPWPVAGVYRAADFYDQVHKLYEGGLGKGEDPGMGLGDIYTIAPGHLTVITGVPGSGKSSLFNQIMVNLAMAKDWTMAVYSSETPPPIHIPMLAQMYLGKPFFKGPHARMTKDELAKGEAWVNDHFIFLHSPDGASYQEIIERLEVAVMRFGIRGFVIDPANYLRRPHGDDVEWVGEMLEAFRAFAQSHDCHAWVVAHPKKMEPGRVPTGYDVAASAHWYNRPDFGVTVHRPEDNRTVTQFHVWKVRFSWTGKEGREELYYDVPTGRFSDFPFGAQRYQPPERIEGAPDPWDFKGRK